MRYLRRLNWCRRGRLRLLPGVALPVEEGALRLRPPRQVEARQHQAEAQALPLLEEAAQRRPRLPCPRIATLPRP